MQLLGLAGCATAAGGGGSTAAQPEADVAAAAPSSSLRTTTLAGAHPAAQPDAAPATPAATTAPAALDDDLLQLLCCPITHEPMRDPVVAADGHTPTSAPPSRVGGDCSSGWRSLLPHLASCFYLTFPLLPRFPPICVQAGSRGRRQRGRRPRRHSPTRRWRTRTWCPATPCEPSSPCMANEACCRAEMQAQQPTMPLFHSALHALPRSAPSCLPLPLGLPCCITTQLPDSFALPRLPACSAALHSCSAQLFCTFDPTVTYAPAETPAGSAATALAWTSREGPRPRAATRPPCCHCAERCRLRHGAGGAGVSSAATTAWLGRAGGRACLQQRQGEEDRGAGGQTSGEDRPNGEE